MGLFDLGFVLCIDRLHVPFACGAGFFFKLVESCCSIFLGLILGLPVSGWFEFKGSSFNELHEASIHIKGRGVGECDYQDGLIKCLLFEGFDKCKEFPMEFCPSHIYDQGPGCFSM